MKGARNRPLFPIIASICPCSQFTMSSTTICHPDGTSFRLRVARKAMRMTTAIVSQVMQRVSQLKVKPANCTVSRTPISCIYLNLLPVIHLGYFPPIFNTMRWTSASP